jgi:hypothetical protein
MTFPDQSTRLSMTKVRSHAAGIDIGATEHWVCVDPGLTATHVRTFGTFTEDLIGLVA